MCHSARNAVAPTKIEKAIVSKLCHQELEIATNAVAPNTIAKSGFVGSVIGSANVIANEP